MQAIAEGRWDRSWIEPLEKKQGLSVMGRKIKLRDICYARSGDKGDTVNIGLACYDAADYDWVRQNVTVQAVLAHFGRWVRGPAERFELPGLRL